MVEKGIRGAICHFIYQYSKPNNKYTKDYDKSKELTCLQIWDGNNSYGWAMSQKLPVNNFVWIEVILNSIKISAKTIRKRVI